MLLVVTAPPSAPTHCLCESKPQMQTGYMNLKVNKLNQHLKIKISSRGIYDLSQSVTK